MSMSGLKKKAERKEHQSEQDGVVVVIVVFFELLLSTTTTSSTFISFSLFVLSFSFARSPVTYVVELLDGQSAEGLRLRVADLEE